MIERFCHSYLKNVKGPFKYYVIVGEWGQMLTFAYIVGGGVWQDAYVIKKYFLKKNIVKSRGSPAFMPMLVYILYAYVLTWLRNVYLAVDCAGSRLLRFALRRPRLLYFTPSSHIFYGFKNIKIEGRNSSAPPPGRFESHYDNGVRCTETPGCRVSYGL